MKTAIVLGTLALAALCSAQLPVGDGRVYLPSPVQILINYQFGENNGMMQGDGKPMDGKVLKEGLSKLKEMLKENCECNPRGVEEDFSEEELEAWAKKVFKMKDFFEEHGPEPKNGTGEHMKWTLKLVYFTLNKMHEAAKKYEHVLKLATLKCKLMNDEDDEDNYDDDEDSEGGVLDGIGEMDVMNGNGTWTQEEFHLKVLMTKLKMIFKFNKKYSTAYSSLAGCKRDGVDHFMEMLKKKAVMGMDEMEKNVTAADRVKMMMHFVKEGVHHMLTFVYKHKAVFKVPERCFEEVREKLMAVKDLDDKAAHKVHDLVKKYLGSKMADYMGNM